MHRPRWCKASRQEIKDICACFYGTWGRVMPAGAWLLTRALMAYSGNYSPSLAADFFILEGASSSSLPFFFFICPSYPSFFLLFFIYSSSSSFSPPFLFLLLLRLLFLFPPLPSPTRDTANANTWTIDLEPNTT